MKPLLAAMLVAYGLGNPAAPAAQAKPPDDIRITSAIFGMRDGSADVTPMVVHLSKPGLEEFYAAPFWLEVDPVVGQNKTLEPRHPGRAREPGHTATARRGRGERPRHPERVLRSWPHVRPGHVARARTDSS
jgi:hypothetical protein